MKKHLAFTICIIQALTAIAGHITREEALALAQDFMQGKVMMPVQTSTGRAPLRGGANDESYYIFNAADNGGYAIIAADDRVNPVLGFSDRGNINLDNMPENMASWLEYYDHEIRNLKNDAEIVLDAPVFRNEIKPLLNNYWHQDAPYNLLCPVYDGIQCPVGCVALAMAQIMYYHKWPVGEIDSIPPYANSFHNYELVEGLPAITFKWDLVKPSYGSHETDESAYAVAELLRYCGQAVEMGYETGSSCANSEDVPKALIERFNYSRQTEMVYKWDYSSYDWDELIFNELASGRPVFYSGQRLLEDGHAFVCDGYKDGYYHINWGQGYCYDGYFKLSLLHMEGADLYDQYNYGLGQLAIIGIEPEKSSLTGTTFTDDYFKYTLLTDTSAMIQAIEDKDYHGTDTLWIPDHVDYNGSRYHVTRLGCSQNLDYDFLEVCLPSSLKQIDTEASFLQTIRDFTITSNIEALSSTAFCYNDSLEKFIAEEGYTRYKIIDGVLFSHDGKEIICYPQGRKAASYIVPDGVETIGSCTFFYNQILSDVILPDCVEHINDWAFYYCSNLKRISLPDNLKEIGIGAFADCYDLNDVTLPQNIGTVSKKAFSECSSLKSIIIPNSLNNCLGVGTFQDCSSLESVYIPSGIKWIKSDCFNGCTALKEIIIESVVPPAIESVSVFDDTVYENAVLKVPANMIELYRNSKIWSRFKNISTIPSYTINGINYILNESAKTAVVSPGQEPYSGDVVIPTVVENNGIEYSVQAFQFGTFAGCKNLTSVVIDAHVSVLPDSLFKDCSSLKSIKLNDGIVKIGCFVFSGCSSLAAIDIPQGVVSIGESLFRECKSLHTVTIPESVKELGRFAFMNCSNLDSAIIYADIKEINFNTFYGCTGLTYISLPENITYIVAGAFYNCSSLKSIILPKNILFINDYTISYCTSLTSITLPEKLISIGMYTVCNCKSLETITIPATVRRIEKGAFMNCSNLTSFYCCVENPQEIGMGEYVFYNINADCILYVPQGSVQAYRDDERWNAFSEIREIDKTEVEPVAHEAAVPVEYYNLSGNKLPAPQRGINLIRYSDGTVRKVTQ